MISLADGGKNPALYWPSKINEIYYSIDVFNAQGVPKKIVVNFLPFDWEPLISFLWRCKNTQTQNYKLKQEMCSRKFVVNGLLNTS